MDCKSRDEILGGVIAFYLPTLRIPGEFTDSSFSLYRGEEGEVGGEGLRETVDVVVWHEPYDHVGHYFAVFPGFGFAGLSEIVYLGVVENLGGMGFGDAGEGLGEGGCEGEVFEEMDAVGLGFVS